MRHSAPRLPALNRQIVSHSPVNDTLGCLHWDAMPVSAWQRWNAALLPFHQSSVGQLGAKLWECSMGYLSPKSRTTGYQYRLAKRPDLLAPYRLAAKCNHQSLKERFNFK